ncbi:DUF2569 domain-containing protein [Sphingopyxis sp. BSN-002]|uniref:DUF2569 family protein n=1 Tax=Sphingopyxis sp. BSN-002 TaxID=2911495 RepID=UPI001EDA19BD|nr:DUF2569 family protein [Sphingopyxis sp. BSN-002]UKK85434.1 DUF2569 domain-containing protein [Sphingopyxis sp. BSN-002]
MTDFTEEPQLKGVGGWLGFFVFILGIVSPARMLFQASANIAEVDAAAHLLGPGTGTYVAISWALIIVSVAGSVFMAYRLLAVHRWSSVVIGVIGLWCLAILPTLVDLAVSAIMFPKFAGAAVPEALLSIGKSCISATVWTLYLAKSKRVANTYAKDISETQRIFG